MTQRNCRGAYMDFTHDRPDDWHWLAAWQPNVIRYMTPGSHTNPNSVDMGRIKRLHDTCPDATILLRCWDVDDRNFEAHDAMVQDPQGEAQRQVSWWSAVFDNAERAGIPRVQLMAGLNNETGPEKDAALLTYTQRALDLATLQRVRLGCYVFSVGRPSLEGEAPYDIPRFAQLDSMIVANRGAICLNEYMQPEGMYAVWKDDQGNERKDYTYLIGRHLRWSVKADIIISEWGVDGLLYNRHPDPHYGNSGWLNFPHDWPPTRYGDEYVECVRKASDNVIAICPFISDFNDHKWQSFDLLPGYSEFLARKDLCVKDAADTPPVTVHLPDIKAPSQPEPQGDNWQRTMNFIHRWEGGFQDYDWDIGNWTGCEVGKGEKKGTNFGISACSYPNLDIRNLTLEQADEIYRRDYWQASGADKLPWPYCLIAMDTAVLHGVGTARNWLAEYGDNLNAFVGRRLHSYTNSKAWKQAGAGWVNRVADLMLVASQP